MVTALKKPAQVFITAATINAPDGAPGAVRPGVLAREVDRAARGYLEEAGYARYFVHRTGHGPGLEVHEPPYITAESRIVLQPGMVFSIEPGTYSQTGSGCALRTLWL